MKTWLDGCIPNKFKIISLDEIDENNVLDGLVFVVTKVPEGEALTELSKIIQGHINCFKKSASYRIAFNQNVPNSLDTYLKTFRMADRDKVGQLGYNLVDMNPISGLIIIGNSARIKVTSIDTDPVSDYRVSLVDIVLMKWLSESMRQCPSKYVDIQSEFIWMYEDPIIQLDGQVRYRKVSQSMGIGLARNFFNDCINFAIRDGLCKDFDMEFTPNEGINVSLNTVMGWKLKVHVSSVRQLDKDLELFYEDE